MLMKTLLIYFIITFAITLILLYICHKVIKEDKTKNLILKISAIVTVILHYSTLWIDYLTTGSANVDSVMLFPIYPCNIVMWMLLIVSLMRNQDSKIYKVLTDFIFYVGTFCGIIGIVINENYLNKQDLTNYSILKGLISHSTMLFGCLYLYVMKYVKINMKNNLISVVIGLMTFIVIGVFINTLFSICNLPPVNAMYLQKAPFPDLPFINTLTIGIAGVVITFILSTILEIINLPKEERWYKKFFNKGEEQCTI